MTLTRDETTTRQQWSTWRAPAPEGWGYTVRQFYLVPVDAAPSPGRGDGA